MRLQTNRQAGYEASLECHGIGEYRVRDSVQSATHVVRRMDKAIYEAHGPDYRLHNTTAKELVAAATLTEYGRLLRQLKDISQLRFVTHAEALDQSNSAGSSVCCAMRHDVDADIGTALAMARLEQRLGVSSTYAILHTAPYYGRLEEGVFLRHEAMAEVYRDIAAAGNEIAIHTDPLYLYQEAQIDGAEALRTEIEWLRSQGLIIKGSISHNSPQTYGVSNYAIFKGRLRPSVLQSALRAPQRRPERDDQVVFNGKWAPLGVLAEEDLGLVYEGEDLLRRDAALTAYAAVKGVDNWVWATDMVRTWDDPRINLRDGYTTDEIISRIAALPRGAIVVMNVHPEYFSARADIDADPTTPVCRRSTTFNSSLGWMTYSPFALQAHYGSMQGETEFQSLNIANGLGMLDLPYQEATAGDTLRIAVFGSSNVNGASIMLPAQAHRRLARAMEKCLGRPVAVRKFAFPGMGLARLYSWYEAVRSNWSPDILVLGIGADEIDASVPEFWSRRTGYTTWAPPGDYLRWADGVVRVVSRSRFASLLPRIKRSGRRPPNFTDENLSGDEGRSRMVRQVTECARYFVERAHRNGTRVVLLVQECGESVGTWSNSAPIEDRRRRHRLFRAFLDPVAESLAVQVADPYPAFLNDPGTSGCHWTTVPEWNYRGHWHAARAIKTAICQHGG